MKSINVGVKLTEDDISEVENELDVKLSQDYKAFLLQNNGGSLTENLVFDFTQIMPESGEPFDNSSILREFSILSDLPFFYGNLIGAEVIPEKFLPIASIHLIMKFCSAQTKTITEKFTLVITKHTTLKPIIGF